MRQPQLGAMPIHVPANLAATSCTASQAAAPRGRCRPSAVLGPRTVLAIGKCLAVTRRSGQTRQCFSGHPHGYVRWVAG